VDGIKIIQPTFLNLLGNNNLLFIAFNFFCKGKENFSINQVYFTYYFKIIFSEF